MKDDRHGVVCNFQQRLLFGGRSIATGRSWLANDGFTVPPVSCVGPMACRSVASGGLWTTYYTQRKYQRYLLEACLALGLTGQMASSPMGCLAFRLTMTTESLSVLFFVE